MQKSLDIFKAEPKSVFDVLCDTNNTGYYMPAYQRPYSWEEAHIRDLFTDCENVFRNLLESSDAIIFLGSVLTVEDNAAKTVFPVAKRHHPTDIRLIIDGQQRLTTLTLILVSLNERLRLHLPKLKQIIDKETNDSVRESLEGLREIISQLIIDTANTVICTTADHPLYKYLPKIIRSQVDCWGKDNSKAIYESPIAELLITYQRHVLECESPVKFKEFDRSLLSNGSKRVSENLKIIRNQLKDIEAGFQLKGTEQEKLSISDFVNVDTLDLCLDFPVDEDLKLASDNNIKIPPMIFITAFAKFLLHRVCLTYVEVNNESYAFDMFEALNTTGEPLTAIETFVPKVIEHIGEKRKEGEGGADEALLTLNSITERFEKIIVTKEKNDKTKALILAFVRAYKGSVKVTHLRDQRKAMLDSYEKTKVVNKDDYLNYLATTAQFLFEHWQAPVVQVSEFVPAENRDVANLCLRYLVDMKHDIVQPLLVQFLLQDKNWGQVGTENSNFFEVLKAVTSFSVLWRAMSGGADGIDAVYKELHERGFEIAGVYHKPYVLEGSTLSSSEFNIEGIKAFFRHKLESKIITKESPKETPYEKWLDICSKQPLLSKQKSIKLLILAGFHGIKLQEEDFVRSDESRAQFLTTTMWGILSKKDKIKKVYNGSSTKGWEDPSIIDPEIFNKLGNVLVDPRDSIVTNNSWFDIKQALLSALSNDSIVQIDKLTCNFTELSEEAKRHTSILLLESKFEEITFPEQWNKFAIEERTQLLLANAWENLYKWLN